MYFKYICILLKNICIVNTYIYCISKMYISGYINTNMSEICIYVLEKKYMYCKNF